MSNHSHGIDFRDALEILASRSTDAHDDHQECLCTEGHAPSNSKHRQGQTLYLIDQEDGAGQSYTTEMIPKEELERQRNARKQELQSQLQSMSTKERLQTVLNVQEERVAIYREYNRGLEHVLDSANMTTYPSLVAHATASFAVVSDSINAVRDTVVDKKQIHANIQKLQHFEQEKLQLTAAWHLERLRNTGLLSNGNDVQTSQLLQQGVVLLQRKIQDCMEEINQVLDELRCCLLEEDY